MADDGTVLEAGTHHAVYSFIEGQLGVRWLWPGALGTDVPKTREIRIEPVSIRHTPQVRLRRFNMTHYERAYIRRSSKEKRAELARMIKEPREWAKKMDRETIRWLNAHRSDDSHLDSKASALAGSMFHYRNRHNFVGWYDRYGAEHPDWFAMQPDGTRTPYPEPVYAKMCVSNPELVEKLVSDAKAFFEENPYATTYEAAENDHGWEGYCVCENCLAMDNKEAEILEREIRWKDRSEPFYALTDRYAKFWNKIAKRIREEFPGRDVNLSTYAYHVTRPAPTIPLEPNIIPAFVGIERRYYHRNSLRHTFDQRRMWKEWWLALGKRNRLVWRPNIFHLNIGLPYIFTKRHAENMHFMAEHGLAGVIFNSNYGHWAVQGPQLYLTAKLLWDPKGDEQAILADYYERGFGPAASYIAAYFSLFEERYAKLAEQYGHQPFSAYSDAPRMFREIRSDSLPATGRLGQEGVAPDRSLEEKAQVLLDKATAAVAGTGVYHDRVEFIKRGFVFIQLQLNAIEAMNDYNEAPTDSNRERAVAAAERRAAFIRQHAAGYEIHALSLLLSLEKGVKHLGPPQEEPPPPKPVQEEEEKKMILNLEA